jgi:hypothetical protein
MIQQMESKAPKLGRDEDQEGTSKMMLETECSCKFSSMLSLK